MSATETGFHQLAERLGGRLLSVTRHPGGTARNTVIEIDAGAGPRKLFVRQPPYEGAGAVLRDEAQLLAELKQGALPVPAPVWVDPEGEALGSPTLVLEFVEGQTIYAASDPAPLARELARQLAAIHATPVTGDVRQRLQQRRTEIEARLFKPAEHPDASIDEAGIRAVLAAIPPPRANPPRLLHGDFWPGNVLWKDGAISAVVDWEDAFWGDPLFDVAVSRLDLLWSYSEGALEPFTCAYAAAAPQVDMGALPWFDLLVCLRPAGHVSFWAAQWPRLGRPEVTADVMRAKLASFRDRALEACQSLTL